MRISTRKGEGRPSGSSSRLRQDTTISTNRIQFFWSEVRGHTSSTLGTLTGTATLPPKPGIRANGTAPSPHCYVYTARRKTAGCLQPIGSDGVIYVVRRLTPQNSSHGWWTQMFQDVHSARSALPSRISPTVPTKTAYGVTALCSLRKVCLGTA